MITNIIILWIMMDGSSLAVFVALLMVMPIIWQNTMDAYSSIDINLLEITEVFEFSEKKKFKILILPTLKKFLYPAIITSAGLAWKAEIAAEIIAYTKKSIGQGINDAKYNMDTPTVFAWTLLIILFSILLELGTKKLLRRFK
jgi:NitT/TauT family transport system permease protein